MKKKNPIKTVRRTTLLKGGNPRMKNKIAALILCFMLAFSTASIIGAEKPRRMADLLLGLSMSTTTTPADLGTEPWSIPTNTSRMQSTSRCPATPSTSSTVSMSKPLR